MKRLFGLNPFLLVYIVIAVATATHTAWGAAQTMQGAMPTEPLPQVGWWMQGLAAAIAIDITMLLTATKVRSNSQSSASVRVWRWRVPINWYIMTFAFTAVISTYSQVLYGFAHSGALVASAGVSPEWQARLQGLVDARIIIVPLALPVTALLYTVAGLGKGGERVSSKRPAPSDRPAPIPPSTITIERPVQDIPLLDADVSSGQDKRAIVLAYIKDHPEAVGYSARTLERLTGVSKSTCNNVLKELRP